MMVFVETSAFYAILNRADANHLRAGESWRNLLGQNAALVTSNYVLVETTALLQHRLGIEAVRVFHTDVVPLLRIEWVEEARHHAGVEATLAAGRRKLSLVDCISFQVMREHGIVTAFCFDDDFREQGFEVRPALP